MKRNDNTILLYSTEAYYTHEKMDALHLLKGTAIVYIVPWKKEEEKAGKRLLLGEIQEGRVIPALAYKDIDYTYWRFCLVPKENNIEFEILPESCTKVLKEKFLRQMGFHSYQQEGYEATLIDYYNIELLKDEVYVQRSKKDEKKISREADRVIVSALKNSSDVISKSGTSTIYRIVSYACRKGGFSIADEDKVIAAYGKNMTVPEIAQESHFSCREVVLEADWYKNDCGILIGMMNGDPVACIPKGRSGYTVYSGGTEKKGKITRKQAGMIEPKAYSIGRTLPQKALTRKDLIQYCKKSINGGDIAWVLLLGLIGNLIGVLLPTLNRMIYDDYIPIGDYGLLIQMCALMLSFMVGNLFFSLVKKLSEFRISSRVGYDLQNAMYYRIFQLPESFFRQYDSADLAQRLMQFGTVSNQITTQIVTTGFASLFSLVYLVRMFTYSGKLTIIAMLMVLLLMLLLFFLNTYALRYERKIAENDGDAASRIYQYLNAIEKIRIAGAEERAVLEYMIPFSEKQQNSIRKNRVSAVSSVILDVAAYLFSMVLYFVIVKKKMNLSTGSFIAFNSAFGTFSATMLQLMKSAITLYEMKAVLERLHPIISVAAEDDDGKDSVTDISGDISLEHITFSYDEGAKKVLNDFSLKVHPGEYVAIVGPSGCGKSTLLKLMLGFEKPKTGRVCYDGKDLEKLNKHTLRKRLGVVLQNGKLISGSIYENVTITADHPSMKEVNEIIEAVGLKEDIAAMPMGIHTMLSESGGTISGGQQQRILIARSIMNHPKILFFDEATSALDNITQSKVCNNLDKMHMTRIVIAHRLSTIKNCDRIIVIQDGQIVEEGKYNILMEKRGLFYQMACRQIAE